LHSKLTMTRPF